MSGMRRPRGTGGVQSCLAQGRRYYRRSCGTMQGRAISGGGLSKGVEEFDN